ncbi:hypothetical protein L218DRAFT_1000304 [Marasmius fiardii PR-910]|nr:hypothetical protein L218DRAFT_1000304 [Marasmius fiardii PR-910]
MDSQILTYDDHVQAVYEHYMHQILLVLPATFLIWDHIITLGSEIQYVWSHPKSRSSYFFLFLRYFGLLSMISIVAVELYPLEEEGYVRLALGPKTRTNRNHSRRCKRFSRYRDILYVITHLIVCFLLTLRIYAIFNRDNRFLAFMCGSVVVSLGVVIYVIVRQKKIPYPFQITCHDGQSVESAHRVVWAWIAVFIYDAILFFLTAVRTFRYYFRTRPDPGVLHFPLLSLMFRDGAMYFGVMALVNLPNILTYYIAGPFMRGGLSSFTSCIAVTMMCRLMLNLHATADTGLSTRPSDPRRTRTEYFDRQMEFTVDVTTMVTIDMVLNSVLLDDSESERASSIEVV